MHSLQSTEQAKTEPAALHAQALSHLRYVRSAIESAAAFTAVPGAAGVAMGGTALLACALAALPALRPHWLAIWLGAAVIGIAAGATFMARKARRNGVTLANGSARRFVLALSAPIAAGAVLTPVMLHTGAAEYAPGMWLLLYGAGVVAAGALSIRLVAAMGLSFMALGSTTLFLPALDANLMLGLGFGGLHIVFGMLIARYHGG